MADETRLQEQLSALRQQFVEGLPARLAALEAALEKWRSSQDAAELAEFHRLAHSLTGAGATFGCEALSQMARALERQLTSAEQARDFETVERLLTEVREACSKAGREEYVAPVLPPQPLTQVLHERRVVYILEEGETEGKSLAAQLEHFGYATEVFSTPLALKEAVQTRRPAAIIIELTMTAGGLAGIDVVHSIHAGLEAPVPTIFISAHGDFEVRLEAVRAGGRAYFQKPLSIEALVDMVDELTSVEEKPPFRILIVDDSHSQATFYANVLQQAGMKTRIECESAKVLEAIRDFSPELVLMDKFMPFCSGVELAAVIRQQPAWLGLPIVFLSAETDRHAQLQAMSRGGDDFLTKPIQPMDLVDSVTIRAERYRLLRSRMSQDSLTGLLNHRRLMESLSNEVDRVQRHGGEMAFVMFDIDHFKQVNDSYGHAIGDRVIKSLARLLKQRLRSTDIIGRYGGEEFAVIMPETSLQAAIQVVDEIRRHFADLDHRAGEQLFAVTLSGGIATCPPRADVGELCEAADQMLYQAKQNGRNQIGVPERRA
jgi:diguanylate cyclase (GGDEF)-like protein